MQEKINDTELKVLKSALNEKSFSYFIVVIICIMSWALEIQKKEISFLLASCLLLTALTLVATFFYYKNNKVIGDLRFKNAQITEDIIVELIEPDIIKGQKQSYYIETKEFNQFNIEDKIKIKVSDLSHKILEIKREA